MAATFCVIFVQLLCYSLSMTTMYNNAGISREQYVSQQASEQVSMATRDAMASEQVSEQVSMATPDAMASQQVSEQVSVAAQGSFNVTAGPETTSAGCYDVKGRDCFMYTDIQCIGKYEGWARANCALRCGYCKERLPCVDLITYCDEFGKGTCTDELYGQYIRENCRKTCNLCRAPTDYLTAPPTPVPTTTTAAPTTYNPVSEWCFDNKAKAIDCWYYADEKCVGDYEAWGRRECPYRCGYCPGYKPPCVDLSPDCKNFPNGTCTSHTYRTYMRMNCRKFCGECNYPGDDLTPNVPHQPTIGSSTLTPLPPKTTHAQPQVQTSTTHEVQPPSPSNPVVPVCEDKINCTEYTYTSCVGIFTPWAKENCARHCGYCGGVSPCEDSEQCEGLPNDLCTNPEFQDIATTACRKFCGFCSVRTTASPEGSTIKQLIPTKPSLIATTEEPVVPTKPSVAGRTDGSDQGTTDKHPQHPTKPSHVAKTEEVKVLTKPVHTK